MSGAAAIIVLKEKQLVEHFRQARAISAATAQTAAVLRIDQNIAFRILHRDGILRDAEGGRFYLDEGAWESLRQRRRRLVTILLSLFVVAAAAAWFFRAR